MNKSYIDFLKKNVFRDKKYFIFVCFITVIQSLILIYIPYITKNLLDNVLPGRDYNKFIQMILIMFLCYLFLSGFNVLKDYLLAIIAENVCLKLRTQMNEKIATVNYSYYEEHSLGDILSKYNKEVDTIKENCGYMLTRAVSNVATFLLAGLMIFIIDWRVMVVSIIILFFYVLNNKFWGIKVKKYAEKSMECNEWSVSTITENYQNALITKLYSAYNYIDNKFQKIYKEQYKIQINLESVYSININLSTMLIYLLTVLIWLIGGIGIFNGNMTIGSITALLSYQGMLISPTTFFSGFNNSYNSTLIAINRLEEILNADDEDSSGKELKEVIKTISFKNVYFQYKNRESVLKNLNFTLNQGSMTAFVGPSGCGKSTLVKLIMRLYLPNQGNILINDSNIETFCVQDIRSKIAFIAQDSLFFNDSIIQNIALGTQVSEEELLKYAKELDILAEINNMPEHWETQISAGSNNISGGQKKRLDILRALLRNADVIIFDESTASIDHARRKKLFDILSKIKSQKIIIFITHNTDEYDKFDQIYTIKNNSITNYKNDKG